MDSYQRFAELDVLHFDRVVTTKYPAWMISHPDHHVYMLHKLRGLYDTWPCGLATNLPRPQAPELQRLMQLLVHPAPNRQILPELFGCLAQLREVANVLPPTLWALPGPLIRQVVHTLDGVALAREAVRRYWAISTTVAERTGYFAPDVNVATDVVVLHPPAPTRLTALGSANTGAPPWLTQLTCGQRYVFTASRLDAPKRLSLLVEAHLSSGIDLPLVVAGAGPERPKLDRLAKGRTNVHFVGRLTDSQLADAYRFAAWIPFVPDREDYGLIALEALQAGKPVLTCSDSGGVTELVQHGVNGLVVAPSVTALAAAAKTLANDAPLLQRLSDQAAASVAHIRWATLANAVGRPNKRVTVVNTFGIFPARNGGQVRMLSLYRELARIADIRVVNLTDVGAKATARNLAPGLQEVMVPMTAGHSAFEQTLTQRLKCPCSDIAAMLRPDLTPAWLTQIADACQWADVVVACHPYALPAIRKVWQGPVVYESLNVEADLKQAIFGHDSDMLQQVEAVERDCAQQAPLVLCCSPEDADRMQQRYALPAAPAVVPNGVDTRAYPKLTVEQRQALAQRLGSHRLHTTLDPDGTTTYKGTALFVGSLHGPNIDAMLALLPIARACPSVLFVVIGSVCDAPGRPTAADCPSNLVMVGRVTDQELRVWLSAADIGLNPMISGSGTNLKMLEYAAAGLPILSTPFGGRGGVLDEGVHFEVADIHDFPEALCRILAPGYQTSRFNMTEAARVCVSERADWRIIAQRMWQALQVVLPTQ